MVNLNQQKSMNTGSSDIGELLLELNDALLVTKSAKKSDDWQQVAGRLVSLIYLRMLQDGVEDEGYLRCAILLSRAQREGVKEARKKSINLSRFKENGPPDIQFATSAEDQKAVFTLLESYRARWCLPFIAKTLVTPSTHHSNHPQLIRWGAKCSSDIQDLWTVVLAPFLVSNFDDKEKLAAIKEFDKCLGSSESKTGHLRSGGQTEAFIRALSSSLIVHSANKKLSLSIFGQIASFISKSRDCNPSIVLDKHFLAGLAQVDAAATTKEVAKQWSGLRQKLAIASASLLNAYLTTLDATALAYWKVHLPLLMRAYPDLVKALKGFETSNSLIVRMLAPTAGPDVSANAQFEAAENVSRLLLSWQNFLETDRDRGEVEALDVMIRDVAKSLGIEFFGQVGARSFFDPVEHRDIDGSDVKSEVVILKPGIRLTRTDGSNKILHPALVR